ncbi:family 43 glycosylhydrolase [Luteolibacter yonseiensis]|uniref:Family 43 glycosylhydrolase n=1 Tax=Luteolibacter yonseiensis TaxID=1144680 RepID=A0A934R6A2_9BACT|nr:family 43 glycosylhydrolase [Luteolibacter yonseiensis]MBK1817021.1 family 43 glycosylhydrolase [Luteolibacter yonseiensis]
MLLRPLLICLSTFVCFAASAAETFVNPISEGADPWVTKYGDKYIWCHSESNQGVALWISDRLTSIGTRHVVWTAPEKGPYSKEVWAPEIHFLDGHWHIYVAASDGKNANHLAYVLRSRDADPLSPYTVHGPLPTGDGKDGKSPNVWAIDMTVLEQGGKRYAIWSGWDAPGTDQQFLYIAPMKSPTELAGPRVLLAKNDTYLWERTEEKQESRGLAEGPQILQNGGRTFVTYSTAASWLPTYKLGLLELTGQDPLDPASWTKHPEPVFKGNDSTYGVGHSCFVKSPDGKEWWHVFHSKRDRNSGWRRSVSIQPFTFDDKGFPNFGNPVAPGVEQPRPSGEVVPKPVLPLSLDFTKGQPKELSYYGHLQFMNFDKDGLQLGRPPADPVNTYRSGEKLVLDGGNFTDFEATTTFSFVKGDRDAGLLFRTTFPSVGFDAQKGYFAGLIPRDKVVVLGKTDGSKWTEISRAPVSIDTKADLKLSVSASGPEIKISLDGKAVLTAKDDTYTSGSVGVRVVDTHVRFTNLEIKAAN